MVLRAVLIAQEDPEIGDEIIEVTAEDGSTERLRLHDYERLYALPTVYEQIVQDRLGCTSPATIARMLAQAVDDAGWTRADVPVIDVAAGNGISGEALVAEGLRPVLGTDIVPEARTAALRDRPELYESYLTLDLLALSDEQRARLSDLHARALSCVAPVGDGDGQVPTPALMAAVELLADDAVVAFMHDPRLNPRDVVGAEQFAAIGRRATEVRRERYLHRRTVNGGTYELVGVVWRVAR
jgi:hypothetical protein